VYCLLVLDSVTSTPQWTVVVVVVVGGGGGERNTNLRSGRASWLCFAEDGGDYVVPALSVVLVLQDLLVL
jgi:hypothetical protein